MITLSKIRRKECFLFGGLAARCLLWFLRVHRGECFVVQVRKHNCATRSLLSISSLNWRVFEEQHESKFPTPVEYGHHFVYPSEIMIFDHKENTTLLHQIRWVILKSAWTCFYTIAKIKSLKVKRRLHIQRNKAHLVIGTYSPV